MKTILSTMILLVASLAGAQCIGNTLGGTNCVGPLRIIEPANPTTVWTFVPETVQFLCAKGATATAWNFCGKNGELEVDYGSGYVSLKGKNGTNGLVVGSSGTLILTCQGEAQHSIPSGFSTTCTYKVIK
jgi:hypothetical protein